MSNQRILLLFWDGHLGLAPSMVSAIRLFVQHGFTVDVVMRSSPWTSSPAPPFPSGVTLVVHQRIGERFSALRRKLDIWGSGAGTTKVSLASGGNQGEPACTLPPRWWRGLYREAWRISTAVDFLGFVITALRVSWFRRYKAVIGVDTHGIVAGWLLHSFRRSCLIHWSLELSFMDNLNTLIERGFKLLERRASRAAANVVVQDPGRAERLSVENRLDKSKIILIPNSPIIPGMLVPERGSFFHDRFGLERSWRIVLHAGMISPAVLSLELASAAAVCSRNYFLVLHERRERDANEPYLKAVKDAGRGRVGLSLNPVAFDDLQHIYSSADVGIVVYNPAYGPNFSEIAGASGKLAYFLRFGVPVICNDLPSLRALVEQTRCGVVVDDLTDIPAALDAIFDDYDEYRSHARACFRQRYDFEAPFQNLLAQIK